VVPLRDTKGHVFDLLHMPRDADARRGHMENINPEDFPRRRRPSWAAQEGTAQVGSVHPGPPWATSPFLSFYFFSFLFFFFFSAEGLTCMCDAQMPPRRQKSPPAPLSWAPSPRYPSGTNLLLITTLFFFLLETRVTWSTSIRSMPPQKTEEPSSPPRAPSTRTLRRRLKLRALRLGVEERQDGGAGAPRGIKQILRQHQEQRQQEYERESMTPPAPLGPSTRDSLSRRLKSEGLEVRGKEGGSMVVQVHPGYRNRSAATTITTTTQREERQMLSSPSSWGWLEGWCGGSSTVVAGDLGCQTDPEQRQQE